MKAQDKRHINPTTRYDHLIPRSIGKDTIVMGSGSAKLEDTLQLMQGVIRETLSDTALLAKQFKSNHINDTCRNIWNFVYQHIQYTMDKTGIEQVRRPSRTWADRKTGVDCDCYTVFIGSVLTNLNIPFKMRITKYGGKRHFQHVYPIVPTRNGHITIDCVTDTFNHEVAYSDKKDISATQNPTGLEGLGILSGVDTMDIGLNALEQPTVPLRKIISHKQILPHCPTPKAPVQNAPIKRKKQGRTLSPFRWEDGKQFKTASSNKEKTPLQWLIISAISVAAGIGVYRMIGKRIKKTNQRAKRPK